MQPIICIMITLNTIALIGAAVCISDAMEIMKQFKNDKND